MPTLKPWLYLPVSLAHSMSHYYLSLYGKTHAPNIKTWQPLQWRNLHFPNRLGIAGGVDKDGTNIPGWWAYGSGFLEIGTVTPLPQEPNAGKILGRDKKKLAVWNRMGFPSKGMVTVAKNLAKIKSPKPTPILINVGKNRSTPTHESHKDYLAVMNQLHDYADIFVLNISSPNTSGLRDLQSELALRDLLKNTLLVYRDQYKNQARPVLLKLSPDLNSADFEAALKVSLEFEIDGWILTNTTLTRYEGSPFPKEGGVSGKPLKGISRNCLRLALNILGTQRSGKLIISTGGIDSIEEIKERLALGADLVQVYSALIFEGPCFFSEMAAASSP